MKRFITLALAVASVFAAFAPDCGAQAPTDMPYIIAHRGCWLKSGKQFYINENSLEGIRMAKRYGYKAVEMDARKTADGVLVVMHDKTINRTMRLADGYAEIPEPVETANTTFEVLRRDYVLASSDPALRVPIPTLEEMLTVCKEEGIVAMLHSNIIESYRMAQEILGDDGWIAFYGSAERMGKARALSNCLCLLDPREIPAEETIEALKKIGGRCGMSTMRYKMLDADYIRKVRSAGFEVQASIFPSDQTQRAVRDGVSIVLSDSYWYNVEGRTPSDSKVEQNKTLKAEETLEFAFDKEKFFGATLDLEFKGDLDVVMGSKTFHLSHPKMARECLGMRFYKTGLKIKLKATTGDVKLKSAKADLYKL